MECIVLAGGLGTRLKSAIGDYPKCMAPVNNKPFLHYLFSYLESQKCTRLILSLGYKHEIVTDWLMTQSIPFEMDMVIEYEPLGTGGGMQLAMRKATEENVVIVNGDTLFRTDINEQLHYHNNHTGALTIALKQMHQFDRYGSVILDEKDCIISFEEKKYCKAGWINGGVYIVNKKAYLDKGLPEKHSFEKDYLEAFVTERKFYGFESDGYFIDIGIPEDYNKTQEDFKWLFQ